MAVTAKKNKARLDFANAIEEMVPVIKNENEEVNINSEEPIENINQEVMTEDNSNNVEKNINATEKSEIAEDTVEETETDDLDELLSSMSQASGKQKSVYLEYDNYTYIQEKCEKGNVKFSTVLNILLRKAIQEQK